MEAAKGSHNPQGWYTAQLLITLHYCNTQNVCAKSKPFREQFVCFASRIHVRDRFLTSILPWRHSWLPTRLWSHQILTKFDRSYTNARSRLFTVQYFQHTVCSVRYNLTTSIYFKELLEEKKKQTVNSQGSDSHPIINIPPQTHTPRHPENGESIKKGSLKNFPESSHIQGFRGS